MTEVGVCGRLVGWNIMGGVDLGDMLSELVWRRWMAGWRSSLVSVLLPISDSFSNLRWSSHFASVFVF